MIHHEGEMNMREHQKAKETDKERLSRLIREAELDMKTIIEARDAVCTALSPYENETDKQVKKRNKLRANNLIGRLFVGSLVDGEVDSAEVIRRLTDHNEAAGWVSRLDNEPKFFWTTKVARTIRTAGKQYTRLLFGPENEENV